MSPDDERVTDQGLRSMSFPVMALYIARSSSLDLVRKCPLRVIRSEEEYDHAIAILAGKRKLGVKHIQALARFFKVKAAVFLDE
jgi:hypothetical protein